MSYVNDTKPTGSYSSDTKPTTASNPVKQGSPIASGFFMLLTYAAAGSGFTSDTKPTGSYSNDIKP